MGITEAITTILAVLKLIGKINWSWWLVLLPEIIGISIDIIFFSILLINSSRRDE